MKATEWMQIAECDSDAQAFRIIKKLIKEYYQLHPIPDVEFARDATGCKIKMRGITTEFQMWAFVHRVEGMILMDRAHEAASE